MTTKVVTTVVCPNVHRARISTQDKQADGTWVEAYGTFVEIGQTVLHDGYITDTRRIVIEEVPLPPKAEA
jgi:hypothetical protein